MTGEKHKPTYDSVNEFLEHYIKIDIYKNHKQMTGKIENQEIQLTLDFLWV